MLKNKKELFAMSTTELGDLLVQAYAKIAKIKIQHQVSPLKNNQLIKKYKIMIARVKTFMATTSRLGEADEQ